MSRPENAVMIGSRPAPAETMMSSQLSALTSPTATFTPLGKLPGSTILNSRSSVPVVSKRRIVASPAVREPATMFTVPNWPTAPTARLTPPRPALPAKALKLAVGWSEPSPYTFTSEVLAPVPTAMVSLVFCVLKKALISAAVPLTGGAGRLSVDVPMPEAATRGPRYPAKGRTVPTVFPLPLRTGIVCEAEASPNRSPSVLPNWNTGDIIPSSSCSRVWQWKTYLPGKSSARNRMVTLPNAGIMITSSGET
jgi:hypothetical protein